MASEDPEAPFTLVTSETKTGVVTPEDELMVAAAATGVGVVRLSGEQLVELAKHARLVMDEFLVLAAGIVDAERAAFVRRLRVERGYSWRAVAAECFDAWKGEWSPPSNQLMGIALCEAAAALLGEDPNREPWN